MTRECHVRICKHLGGRFPGVTRPCSESFFHTLKVEAIHGELFPTRESMREVVFEYIESDYNRIRRHTSISNTSPVIYEMAHAA